jgi:hypothetical protein
LRVAYVASRYISFTQRPGYADYGRIQFTNVTGGDIYSSGRIELIPNDTDQTVVLGNGLTSRRLASSTNYGAYGPTPPGFLVSANSAFVVLSANLDVNTDSFVFSGPTGARHFFKVVQNNVPYFTIMPTGNVLINTTTDAGYKLDVNGTTRLNGNSLVTGTLTVNGSQNYFSSLNGYIFFSRGAGTGINFSPANVINGASQSAIVIMDSIYGAVNYVGGTHTFNALAINTNINNGGSYNGIVRGIYYNPTLTSLTGTTHRAIETTSGDVLFGSGFYWDNVNGRLGFGTSTPAGKVTIFGGGGLYTTTSASVNSDITMYDENLSSYFQLIKRRSTAIGSFGLPVGSSEIYCNTAFGINSNNYIAFAISASEKARFATTSGNLLIGTTTDAGYKLDVNGTSRFTQAVVVNAGGVKTESGTITAQTGVNSGRMTMFNLRNTGGGYQSAVGTSLAIAFTNRETGAVWSDDVIENVVYSNTAGAVTTGYSFYTHSNQAYNAIPVLAMSINGTNVGIGIASPTDKLHIVDNTNGNKFGRISAGAADASAAWVAQNDQVDNVVYRVFGSGVSGTQMGIALARSASLLANLGGSGKFLLGTFSNTDFVMGTGNAEKMRIVDSTGNVLIGTTTDLGNKLEVNGNINSTGYKINNIAGYTGILNIPMNPPGQQNVDIQSGIIVNIF